MKNKLAGFTILGVISLLTFSSCSVKDDIGNADTSTIYQVRLTDAAGPFTKVNINIQSVLVNYTSDASAGWAVLNTNAGVYDLLTLQNGKDTLLAKGNLNTGQTVRQIRFVLGSGNTVDVGNLTFPLTIPSGAESGLTVQTNQTLNSSTASVLIDFDANASIKAETDGSYSLRPVLSVRLQ
ncbi:MAG TPA: DUF4382 domain-containing protein [Ferruginibacter sp.]|nr:DUF4382 domain-containing protein [Ferruginibacter sp.]